MIVPESLKKEIEMEAKNHGIEYESLGAAVLEASEYDFTAGAKFGFQKGFEHAVGLLRSYAELPTSHNSLRIPAKHMADWLEEIKK